MRDLARHVAGWLELVGSLEGDARSNREGGVTWSLTDIPWPMFNAGVAEASADVGVVEVALAELAESGLPWFWFVLPQTPRSVVERVAASGGIAFDVRAPWMEVARTALPAPAPPDGVSVVEATDDRSVREWALTLQAAYNFPDAGRESWISAALRRNSARPQFRLWTVLAAGRPVAVTLGFVSDGIVAQFGVGVLEEERGNGYGRLVTLVPPAELEAPVAGHWATPDGERLYKRLGMSADGWVTRYLGGIAEIPDTATGDHAR